MIEKCTKQRTPCDINEPRRNSMSQKIACYNNSSSYSKLPSINYDPHIKKKPNRFTYLNKENISTIINTTPHSQLNNSKLCTPKTTLNTTLRSISYATRKQSRADNKSIRDCDDVKEKIRYSKSKLFESNLKYVLT